MKLHRDGDVSDYDRSFFFLPGIGIDPHNIIVGKLHMLRARYKRKDVIKEPKNFPVVGEIGEKDIVEFILGKVDVNDLS